MRKITAIFLLLFSNVHGQNLVNNWSFEDTVSCPVGATQISKAAGWDSYKLTPDYYHYCNGNQLQVGVPSNFNGFQYPRTGQAYAGFISFAYFTINYREVFGSFLNQQLSIGQTYFISFYVSRGFKSNNNNNIGTNKLGLKFSTVPFDFFNPVPINNAAHIYTNTVISDTTNWVKISGTFIADSAYNYFCIGNFYRDSLTTYIKYDSVAALACYYVDDVCISLDSNYCNSLTGFEKQQNSSKPFSIFPNPFNDFLNIEGQGFSEIIVFDNIGMVVYSRVLEKSIYKTSLNLTKLTKGIYSIKIKTKNSYYTQKIIHN